MVTGERSIRVQPGGGARGLHVQLFGDVLVHADGMCVDVPRRALSAFVYLLLHRHAPVSRSTLARLLCPDYPEPQNRARLRANLHALQRALPQVRDVPWLLGGMESVGWNPQAPVWLDVAEFDRLSRDAATSSDAVAVYCGDLAPSLDGDWLHALRAEYARRYVALLDDLLLRHRRMREFSAAIACGERLLAIEPWREDVVRRLVAIRHESGDRSGALAFYEAFAQRLRDELGTQPMPETQLVRDAVLQDASAGPDGRQDPLRSASPPQDALPFVGRESEYACVVEQWERAAQGHGSIVFLSGEAGIGKSRLAEEAARHAQDRGGRVLRGAAGFPQTAPYQCFVQALRSAGPMLTGVELAPVWLAALAGLLPEFRARSGDISAPQLDAERERARVLEAIVRAVLGLARVRPVLLILEDLHWADEADVTALAYVARRVALASVLIVATYRDGEIGSTHPLRPLRRELQTQGLLRQVSPAPLQLADVAILAGSDRARALYERSEGNPLFLTHLLAGGDVHGTDSTLASSPLPLKSLVARRLDGLDSQTQTVAHAAALTGQQFSSELLEEVTGWDASAVARAIDALIERRIVRIPATHGGFEYTFSHQLVREAIAAAVPQDRAAALHRRIALVLERLYPERHRELAAVLTAHYEAAGDFAAAAREHAIAARYALDVGAHETSLQHFTRGLAVAREPALRIELLLGREALLHLRGERSAQLEDLEALNAIASAAGDAGLQREVAYRRLRRAIATGDRESHRTYLEELRGYVGRDGSPEWIRLVRTAEASFYKQDGRYEEAAEAAQGALEAATAMERPSERAEALCLLANLDIARGRFAQAQRMLDEAAAAAESPIAQRLVLEERAHLAIELDDNELLQGVCSELSQLCAAVGDRKGETAAWTWTGIALLRLDRYGEALEALDAGYAIGQEIDDRLRMATIRVNRALLLMTLGAFKEAAALLEPARRIHERHGLHGAVVMCLANLSAIYAYMGDANRSLECARETLRLAKKGGMPAREAEGLENLAEAYGAGGNYSEAIAAMEAAMRTRRDIGSPISQGWALAHLALWHARIGQLEHARRCIDAMLEFEDAIRTGNPWPHVCYWAAAQIFRACGEPGRAGSFLARAYTMMTAQGGNAPAPELRASFFAIRWHVEIAAAYGGGEWPELGPANAAPVRAAQ